MSFTRKSSITINNDLILVALILFLPFGFYVYCLAPNSVRIWDLGFIILDAGYFEDIENFLYFFSYKILTISLLSIWFCSCKHWWRLFILVPLFLEVYRFTSLNIERFNDEYETLKFYYSIPAFVLLTFFLLLISNRLKYYSARKNVNSKLNYEIHELMKKLSLVEVKNVKNTLEDFKILKQKKSKMTKKDYLGSLVEMKNRL